MSSSNMLNSVVSLLIQFNIRSNDYVYQQFNMNIVREIYLLLGQQMPSSKEIDKALNLYRPDEMKVE